ncbi:MAG TPA: hypothetical protein VFA01_06505 [Candidatus Dormibacteraeota bacterium]|jgi:hypothetical protein|nr:hypothetical protein [Candidatus Dormibacteraeota bacterium]
MLRSIVEPAFANNPPLKVSLSTTVVGGAVCVLGSLGVLASFLGILRATLVVTGVGTWIVAVLLLVRGIAAGIATYGGYRMYQYDSSWKSRVVYGIAAYFVTEILLLVTSPVSELLAMVVTAVTYYLVVLSHVPAETTQQPTS